MPLGYEPRLDRKQQPENGCLKIVIPGFVLVVALVLMVWGISTALSQQQPETIPTIAVLPTTTASERALDTLSPTDTPVATTTPDSWGLTGTALLFAIASPTMDYCYWLTPSATPTPTLPITPDEWGATGTALYLADHPYQSPTLEPPRELCLDFPTWTATLTPLALPVRPDIVEFTEEVTAEVSPESELPVITPPATWTPQPAPPVVQPPAQPPAQPAPPVEQPPVIVTQPPVVITAPPVIIVITATLAPSTTPTLTATPTNTATDLPPVLPTLAPSATPTQTWTPSLTASATFTATATPTSSPTPTYTLTPLPSTTPTDTATPTPTDAQTEAVS